VCTVTHALAGVAVLDIWTRTTISDRVESLLGEHFIVSVEFPKVTHETVHAHLIGVFDY
jgi:hypothetical protein